MRIQALAVKLAIALSTVLCAQTPSPSPGSTAELEQRLAAYQHLINDWAGLTRYGSEDSEIGPPRAGERRVVFLGGQVTEYWGRNSSFFPGKPYLNRGINGQTSGQMLVRFRQDVIALRPAVVVIEAGSNDIAGAAGPGTKGTFSDNLISMTELAKVNGIRVIVASILPVCDCYTNQTALRSQVRIADFNDVMKTYASESGSVYLDYYSALAEGRNFKKDLTLDGLFPNEAGYRLMVPLAEHAIAEALKK